MPAPARRPSLISIFLIVGVVAVAMLALAPSAIAAQLGSFIGWLWVTVMSAVAGILGGMLGAA
jgi:hypothetical protein